MNLADYQRAVLRVSLALEPSAADLALLGDEARFRMYRHMIRSRLEGMAEVAFKGTYALVGESAMQASFARFLAEVGPRSRLIREVITDFGRFAQGDRGLLDGAPPQTSDVLGFELAKWEVAYRPAHYPALGESGMRELDFEGRPVLNPTLRQLRLASQMLATCKLNPTPATQGSHFALLVYRPPALNDVRWWAVGAFFAALTERFMCGDGSVAEAVQAVAHDQQRAVDQALLDELATDLTLAVQRGVLLGVRD